MTVYIPDLFAKLVQGLGPTVGYQVYFDYGHVTEIVKNLTEKDRAISPGARQKFPLVWLVMDFAEEKGKVLGEYASVSLDIILTTGASESAPMETRKTTTFLPILYPLYEAFLKGIENSRDFSVPYGMPHTKIDRPYWSGEKDNLGNVFPEPIDAIQIKGLKLIIKQPCS